MPAGCASTCSPRPGLLPLPDKTPLAPVVFGEIAHDDYRVAKVYFESLPGFFVTGNLYRPIGAGPFPAILSPHGHWAYGRLENTDDHSVPGRAISLARQGFVVFTYDMVGYNDSRQLPHTFGGRRERLWGLSLGGLQLWNSIRSLDFLETLPYVRRDAHRRDRRVGRRDADLPARGGRRRIQVAAPVNMISLHMQGGCLCENLPGLRLDTTNVEIAATIAPRPLLMVSATGDWTGRRSKRGVSGDAPHLRTASTPASRVEAVQFDAPHNYNRDSREAMYAWMARWLQHAPADVKRPETVLHRRPAPRSARLPPAPAAGQCRHRGATDGELDSGREAADRHRRSRGPASRRCATRSALAPASPPAAAAASRIERCSWPDPIRSSNAARPSADFRCGTSTFTPYDSAAAGQGPPLRDLQPHRRRPAGRRHRRGRAGGTGRDPRRHPGRTAWPACSPAR